MLRVGEMRGHLAKLRRRVFGVDIVTHQLDEMDRRMDQRAAGRIAQLSLRLQYRDLLRQGARLPPFDEVEFRVFSQNGEDGILWYLFAVLGATNRKCVELGAGDGVECNCANLVVNHGWLGLLVDGNEGLVLRGREFYSRSRETWIWPPTLAHAWITAENVNDLVRDQGMSGEIDLLSLDLDGIDWWVWRALDVVTPRVVVLEYQDCWPADVAVTVPYRPDFVATYDERFIPHYAGASLAAFVLLGRKKGYRLIGCQRYGFNAFFLRDDVGTELFPEVPASVCLRHPKNEAAKARLPGVRDLEWVAVEQVLQGR